METLNEVKYKIEDEGFDYALRKYSTWEEVEDENFQKLLENYLNIAVELEGYIDDNSDYE